jgi:hypothetical protein
MVSAGIVDAQEAIQAKFLRIDLPGHFVGVGPEVSSDRFRFCLTQTVLLFIFGCVLQYLLLR